MIAIYVRQSVDKKDSISIETQIETCKAKVPASNIDDIEIFSDKGFSGKSTARPEFQRMMQHVQDGSVSKIIVYKLDRMSRSLIDFLHMREEFIRHGVVFISCGEDFDTSTPMGKLTINIMMMFAEMERETIQKRITDNYYARGEKGLYLGGYAPFGYTKVETQVNGLKTHMFEENTAESPIVLQMFTQYLNGEPLDGIAGWLNAKGILTRQKKKWSSTTVARLLRNPVYVKAEHKVYRYLMGLGATMVNDISAYTGEHGCFVYGNAQNRKQSKFISLSTDYVTLGLHKGFVEADLWLEVQQALSDKRTRKYMKGGNTSWLQGLIHCSCGHAYHIKKVKTKAKEYKYLYCPGKKNAACPYARSMLPLELFERITSYILRFDVLQKLENNSLSPIHLHFQQFQDMHQTVLSEYTLEFSNQVSLTIFNAICKDFLNWHNMDVMAKKKLCRKIIEKIVVEGKTITITYRAH